MSNQGNVGIGIGAGAIGHVAAGVLADIAGRAIRAIGMSSDALWQQLLWLWDLLVSIVKFFFSLLQWLSR